MVGRLEAFSMLAVCLVSTSAAAQGDPSTAQEGPAAAEKGTAAAEENPTTPPKVSAAPQEGWHTEITGYFRAPMALGISSRPSPDNPTGPSSTQVSYGPNRTVDASYYSFAYTRLQEQDWAEVFVHEKKKHVDAAVGWMGYWFQSVGFRNYDAAWAPGLAYLALDSDFEALGLKPNITFTAGAWWPKFGYFEKYDTYTLGRFRQMGGQLNLNVPLNSDFNLDIVYGFGTGRDGSFNTGAPPLYGASVGADLLTYVNVELIYKKYVDAALHFNTEWTADPNLTQQTMVVDNSYTAAQQAHLTVAGGEANLRAPYAGHLWISPSVISVRNGWALDSAGTEVMHSLSGAGIAANYFAYQHSLGNSTGTGSMFNLGFLYENTLSSIQGKAPGSLAHELTLSIFGLLADASLDLPAGSTITQKSIKQFKYGADLTVEALDWLAFMIRYDFVNDYTGQPGYVFASGTVRAIVASHFLSSERIYFQYSRYVYGDNMVLAGQAPWGEALVAGNDVIQAGPYAGQKPDANVVKLQAEIAF
jgi:hypothetical protein